MTDFDAIAQGMTQAVPFAGHLGLEITSVAEGEAVVRLPERAELTNHVGSQHAGALFTVAETASGAAFVGAFAERLGEVTPLARSAEISYEKIAKGTDRGERQAGRAGGRGAGHARRRGQGRVPLRGRARRRVRHAGGHGDRALARAAQQAGHGRGMSLVPLERDDTGLVVARFDSPPLNLFNRQLFEDLQAAIAAVEADPPRALLFRAEGRAVSGGVDVHEFDGLTPERASELWDELIGTVERVEALPLPVVFAAHALTLTAAFELALGCDLILAARSAQFGLVEKVVGLTPSMGGTQRLAERAGSGRARHFVMSGELFGAETMEQWGVVNLLFEDEEFDQRARAYAAELAAGPTKAHAMTKHILRRYREGGIPAADQAVREDAGDLFATEDLQGAVKTFLDKGPGHAEFQGR